MKKDIRKIRGYLRAFLREHQDWVLEVGGDFLAKKGLDFNTWSTSIVGNYMPLDELGLLCLARLWHHHFAVILKDFIWTTGIGIALEDCCVVFAYCGGFLLRDTVEIKSLMHLPLYQTLYGTTDQENALDLSAYRPALTENGASNLDSVNIETSGETSANLDSANVDSASVLNNKENGINVPASKPEPKPKSKPKPKTKDDKNKRKTSTVSKENVKPKKKRPTRRSTRSLSRSVTRSH